MGYDPLVGTQPPGRPVQDPGPVPEATLVLYDCCGVANPRVYVVPHTTETQLLRHKLHQCHGHLLNEVSCPVEVGELILLLFIGVGSPAPMDAYLCQPTADAQPVRLVNFVSTGSIP
jgi:hypothetical protein